MKLRVKILLSVGIIFFLSLGFSTIIHIQNLKQNYLEALEWRAEALAQPITANILKWYNEMQTPLEQVQGLLTASSVQCVKIYEAGQDRYITHVAVINIDGVIVAHNKSELLDVPVESPILKSSLALRVGTTVLDGESYHSLIPLFGEDGTHLGTIDIGIAKRLIDQKVYHIIRQSLGLLGLLLLLTFFILSFIVHYFITKPMGTLSTVAKDIADGNFDQPISIRQRDEIGTLADAFRTMQTTMQQIATLAEDISVGNMTVEVRKRSEHDRLMGALKQMLEGMQAITRSAEEMSTGNLMVSLQERSEQDTLMQALNMMIRHVKSAVMNVRGTSNSIAAVSRQLSFGASQLSNGAAEQAASMEESSSSMEEMAANIRQNADNARQTEQIALQSAEYAQETGRVVAETVVAMQQISQKIAIIEDIASQTRLLSLNATIEAARAQDYGKAFSVVASEVRQLSETTKKAAEEISQLAVSSLDVSEKAGTMLSTLIPSIQRTTELILEISAASNEQSSGTEQINRAIQQADQVTQQNATIAEETASSAEELANQAQQLQHTIAFFTIEEHSREMPEPQSRHDVIAPYSGASKHITRPRERGAEEETTPSPLSKFPANLRLDEDGDEYDAGFERY